MLDTNAAKNKTRKDIVCLTLKIGNTYEKAKEIATSEERSVSNYIRLLINQDYRKKKKLFSNTE